MKLIVKRGMLKCLAVAAVAALMATQASAAKIAVIGGSSDDAFFNLIKKGIDDATPAVQANGGSVNYLRTPNYDNFGPDLVNLINTAINQGVDGIAAIVPVPDAELPALKAAAAKGIKIILVNSGNQFREEVGAISYIGSDNYVAGVAGGEYLAKHGAKKILCHIQIPGAVLLENRCSGIEEGAKKAGAVVVRLPLPASLDQNATGTAEAIKAELLKDPSIDAVVTLAAWAADAAALAIEQAGANGRVKLGTFDLNSAMLERIKAGTQTFAIDQQPYLQGFLATSLLAAYIDFGVAVASDTVPTGPAIIDASNVESVLVGVSKGAR